MLLTKRQKYELKTKAKKLPYSKLKHLTHNDNISNANYVTSWQFYWIHKRTKYWKDSYSETTIFLSLVCLKHGYTATSIVPARTKQSDQSNINLKAKAINMRIINDVKFHGSISINWRSRSWSVIFLSHDDFNGRRVILTM